jgi:hypothetical protein
MVWTKIREEKRTEENRTEQKRREDNRREQKRTEQSRREDNRTEQKRREENFSTSIPFPMLSSSLPGHCSD